MKIGIVQVDGDLPNLALMQICGYHESLGDSVEWWEGPLFNDRYDKIYASKIFSFSVLPQLPSHAIIGGTGIDYKNTLPAEIQNSLPSYSLYPNCNFHVGFSMKGCRFKCEFCCVPQKEGRPFFNSSIVDLLLNPNGGNRLMLLDNDFFVLIGHKSTHEQNIERIMRLKNMGCLPFAMPYDKSDPYQKAFARWVNQRAVFNSCSWDDYIYNPINRNRK